MLPIWITGLAAAGLFAGIAWYLSSLNPGVVALQFAFSPKSFGEIVHYWSADQLLRFRGHLPADYALLLSYGLFGYLLAMRTPIFDTLPPALRRCARWALPVAAAFDATENALHLWLTEAPRFGMQWPYLLAASCALAKWLLLLAYGAGLIVAAGRTKD